MSFFIPAQMMPLSIFQILGTACCRKMQEEFAKKSFSKFLWCYDALSIMDANVFIIWGSLPQKLILTVQDNIHFMPKNGHILHIRGCEDRLQSQTASASLSNALPINTVFSRCIIGKNDYAHMIKEARTCLKA